MENKHIVAGGTVLLAVILILFLVIPRPEKKPVVPEEPLNLNLDNSSKNQQTPEVTKLQFQDIKVGTSEAKVKSGDAIVVHYVGSFLDGQKFDSSRDKGEPFNVIIGAGQVIPGFDQGVIGMRVGGIRKLLVPPDLAYGAQGVGVIPPNTPIQFEIELLEIKSTADVLDEIKENSTPSGSEN